MVNEKELIYKLNREGLDLEHKRDKLADFIGSEDYRKLSDLVQDLLIIQRDSMNIYLRSLEMRLTVLMDNDF